MQSDVEAARLALRQAGLDPLGSIAVIHPGARDPRRRWPVEGFAEVADRLHDNGAQIVVIGSGSELDVVAGVLERTRQAVALTTLSFSELVGVLWSARVLVGNDSGPRHLAEAVGTSTCSIYWFGNLLMAGPATRIRHRVHVSWTTTCPQCDQRYVGDPFPGRCYHSVSHVCDVEVEPVAAAALELMASADAREGLGKGALDGAGRY
jgi:ADP-heptose:LPS heptosyltransferase